VQKGVIIMIDIPLIDGLHLEKLDVLNHEHIWLAKELDNDKLINGRSGYLYPIELLFTDKRYSDRMYLSKDDVYGSPYAIYHYDNPVGFMEISKIFEEFRQVYISYAILRDYRRLGYASKTLKQISQLILSDRINDINLISLIISCTNESSKAVASRAGFIDDGLSPKEHEAQGYVSYQKTKNMLHRENNFS